MIRNTFKALTMALVASAACAGAAQAGGFDRGTADTDILYESGTLTRAGVVYVHPMRDRDTFSPAPGVSLPSSGYENEPYMIPSFAAKFDLTNDLACAGTFTTPFGGNSSFENFTIGGAPVGVDPTSLTGSTRTEFVTREYGATCRYGFEAGKGRFSLLGGVFVQELDYEQRVNFGAFSFKLGDTGFGYRVGAAYEIPEIALRAQVMYRSSVDVDATGDLTTVAGGFPIGPTVGSAKFPQSFEAKIQTGVAPGWLVYASAKWTDWSVFDVLRYTTPLGTSALQYYWRDGWTITGGVAHSFTDTLAGTVSLTWDRGVGTGHDISTDTWTVATGGSYKPNDRVEIRGGVGLSYLTGGSQDFQQVGPDTFIPFPDRFTSDGAWAVATSLSVKVKF